MYAAACVWQSGDIFWQLVLPFHHVSPRDRTQVIRLGTKLVPLPAEPTYWLLIDSLKRSFWLLIREMGISQGWIQDFSRESVDWEFPAAVRFRHQYQV